MMTPEQAVLDAILICVVGSVLTALVSRFRTLAGWLNFVATSAAAFLIYLASVNARPFFERQGFTFQP